MTQFLRLSLSLFFAVMLTNCEQKHNVEGYIKGLGNDTLFVLYKRIPKIFTYNLSYDNKKADTIFVKNGRFKYDNVFNEPVVLDIRKMGGIKKLNGGSIAPSSLSFFLHVFPDDKIKINGYREKYHIDYKVEGSKISSEYNKLRKKKLGIMITDAKSYLKRDTLRFNNAKASELKKVTKKIDENYQLRKKIDAHYIEKNWDSDLTVYLLWSYGKLYQNRNRFSEKVRNGVYKAFIDHEIVRHQRMEEIDRRTNKNLISEGKDAPDFTLKDIVGKNFNLKSANHEFMVLDFWGSWCRPCVEEFPKMKEYYNKYKEQVEFIGIACKDEENKWKKSVKDNSLQWTQLIEDRAKGKDVSLQYAVRTYPTKIIINKKKIIIGVFKGKSDEFYRKLDELMVSSNNGGN